MAAVGTISIDLVAKTGRLLKPMKKAGASVTQFGKTTQIASAGLSKMIAPLAGVAAGFLTVGFAVSKVKAAMGDLDSTQKFADRIGIAADELVGLNLAAERTGAGTSTMQMALQRMTRRLSEAAKGSGEAQGALKELGLNAQTISRLTPDEQIRAIADAMEGVSNQGDRVRLAMKFFDSEGVALVNTMRGGADALDAFSEEAGRLGLKLGDDRRKVEAANDAMDRLKDVIKGVAGQIAVRLAPFLQALSDNLLAAGDGGLTMGEHIQKGVDLAIDAIGFLLDGVDAIRTGFAFAQVGVEYVMVKVVEGIAWAAKGVENFAETVISVVPWAFAQAQQAITESLGWIINKFAEVLTWIDSKLPESMQTGLGKLTKEFSDTFDQVAAEQRQAIENQDYKIDLTFGDTAGEFAAGLNDGLEQSRQNFEEFANREKLSDKLRKSVKKIREDTDAAAAAAAEAVQPDGFLIDEDAAAGAAAAIGGALAKGSQEAFKAIVGTSNKDLPKKQLDETKRQTRILEDLTAKGVFLFPAGLI